MSGQAVPGGPLISGYLDEVGRRLRGPRVGRREVLDELRDGLLEASAIRRREGVPPADATRQAIEEFGTPAQVAAAHAPELALRQARQSAWRIVGLLLLAGLTWQGYTGLFGSPQTAVPDPGSGRQVFLALTGVIKWLPGIAQLAAVGLLLVTFRLRPDQAPHRRRLIGLTALVTTALGATLLTMAAIAVVSAPAVWRDTGTLVVLPLGALAVWAFVESASATARCRATP